MNQTDAVLWRSLACRLDTLVSNLEAEYQQRAGIYEAKYGEKPLSELLRLAAATTPGEA